MRRYGGDLLRLELGGGSIVLSANVSRPPAYIPMGLWWHYCNGTWSISLLKISSTDPPWWPQHWNLASNSLVKYLPMGQSTFFENGSLRVHFQEGQNHDSPFWPKICMSHRNDPLMIFFQKKYFAPLVGNYWPWSRKIIELVASVRLCVCPCSPGWTVRPLTLIFDMG